MPPSGTASSDVSTRCGSGSDNAPVSAFGTATVHMPAACAALRPFGESSKTTQRSGATARRSAASRNRSGAGLTCCHIVPCADGVEPVAQRMLVEERSHPVTGAARGHGCLEAGETGFGHDGRHPREQRHRRTAGEVPGTNHRRERVTVGTAPGAGLKIRIRVEAAKRAERMLPVVEMELAVVLAVDRLPDFEQRCLAVDEQPVEVEDERLEACHVLPAYQ